MSRKIGYISSPYTRGNSMNNIRNQMVVADILKRGGFIPMIPLLLTFFELAFPTYMEEELLDWELAWLERCDFLVRIRFKDPYGVEIPSSGADLEVSHAQDLGIPVFIFESIEELKQNIDLLKGV